jgi:hypothetical protein
MTAQARKPASCKFGNYGRVALIETNGSAPKQIHPNHKAVKRIIKTWEMRNVGSTEKCAFRIALKEAREICENLNNVAQYI